MEQHYPSDGYQNQQQPQRPRSNSRDSFSGRFSSVGGPGVAPSQVAAAYHPAALQSGSVVMQNRGAGLPQSTYLVEDRVRALPSESGTRRYSVRQHSSGSGSGDDSKSTIGPFDSISNVGEREPEGVSAFGGEDWARRDPYVKHRPPSSRVSRNYATRTRHRSGSGESYNPRHSVTQLPLMSNAAGYAGQHNNGDSKGEQEYDEDSMIDGDTVVPAGYKPNQKHQSRDDDAERGIMSSYPPLPYDSAEHEKPGKDGILSTMKGENRSGKRPNVFLRQFRDTTPLDQKIENHKRGIGVQGRPYACWVMGVILIIVFIVELVKSAQKTGKAISTSPFNYMIGPSSEMLINLGARFTGCMKNIPEITDTPFLCLNSTSSSTSTTTSATCSLEDICGFGGFGADGVPHQTFRFFTPLWLHVGVVHVLLNLLVILTSSALVEKQMGTLKFLIIYIVSGVFGFLMGGNFALSGLASMGASGAIFGTHAAVLVDLCSHWHLFAKPGKLLFALLFEVVLGIGLGYIPGIDNFSHIGGFAIGLLLSIVLLPSIHQTRKHRIIVYILRAISLIGAITMFAILYNNFFTSDPNSACEWCRYLSCWPTANNNRCKGTGLTTTTTTTTTSPAPNDGTVGSQQNNASLALIYFVTFLSSSLFPSLRRR